MRNAIQISWITNDGERVERHQSAFCVGRDARGALTLDEQQVVLAHTAVFLRDGRWWVRNLDGATTTHLNGKSFQDAPVPPRAVLQIAGLSAPVLLEVEGSVATMPPTVRAASTPPPPAALTVLAGRALPQASTAATATGGPPISLQADGAEAREFVDTVRVGRAEDATIRIDDDSVSRAHAEIFRLGQQWCVRDLGSSNGTYLDGNRIDQAPLPGRCVLGIGVGGAQIVVSYAAPALGSSAAPKSMEEVAAHYFDPKSQAPAGHHTMMVRKAFTTVQQKQKRKYGSVIFAAVMLLLLAIGVGVYQHIQLQRQTALAEQLFYNMKSMELQLARLEAQVMENANAEQLAEAEKGRVKLADMALQYDALLDELGVVSAKTPPQDRAIIEMARRLGECELGMPKDFVAEVRKYIDIWRRDDRLAKALQRAQGQEIGPIVSEAMRKRHLPAEFFYVALQESDFRPDAVGPATRFGIAKGMWQFMPATADHYGLKIGPLLEQPEFDPDDERFDPVAATDAAARYLSDLYRDEAQASGLLVLASYNWGTTRVRERIRAMKENPRDRNFWALLAQTNVPKETKDYVFLIFAAAVIGENPELFGFGIENPLKQQGSR